jgi:hypothetical protein
MPATKKAAAKARSFRLHPADEELFDRLVAHFAADAPPGFRVTPSDVFRLAVKRLADQELGTGKGRARP